MMKRKMMAADWKTFITLRMYRMSSETFLKNWINSAKALSDCNIF